MGKRTAQRLFLAHPKTLAQGALQGPDSSSTPNGHSARSETSVFGKLLACVLESLLRRCLPT